MDGGKDRHCIILTQEQSACPGLIQDLAAAGAAPLVLTHEPSPRRLPPQAQLCGVVAAEDVGIEPYGPLPFVQAVADARRQARAYRDAGAHCLLVLGPRTLMQARAALLGAREAGLPVLLAMDLVDEGEELYGGGDLLAAFVVLQELGLQAFGFRHDVAGVVLSALEQVQEYSRIPLLSISRSMTEALSPQDAGDLLVRRALALSRMGAAIMGVEGAGRDQLLAAGTALAQAPPPVSSKTNYLDREEIWAADETQVYYLDSRVEFSPPVPCQWDMSDRLLQLEREVWEAQCIRVDSPEDGDSIQRNNPHLTRLPVAFLSDHPAALAAALFAYNGRAIVDSRSALEPKELETIAATYGGVVL